MATPIPCLLYTSDAADEQSSVNLGGRRIIKKKTGKCYATGVALGSPTTADNCGVRSTTNDAPSEFPVGNTTVTWTVTDIHGNTNTCQQTVTVTDNEQPTINFSAPTR